MAESESNIATSFTEEVLVPKKGDDFSSVEVVWLQKIRCSANHSIIENVSGGH